MPRRKYKDPIWRQHGRTPRSVHNFAFPGATAEEDLNEQLSRFFVRFPKKSHPKSIPALDAEKTAYSFSFPSYLYTKAGGSNFVIFDVPPIPRSPSVDSEDEMEDRVTTWNEILRTQALEFATGSQAIVVVFSVHEVLSDILDDPLQLDYAEDDPTNEGGGIWEDDLHLTPAIHAILAERLLSALSAQRRG
ncbi:hypothetical protein B0H10DRAFT_2163163 [Mycena sp. CBHHK59/15]|nr:hypothetical protein B0H10DRAFT_2163163 [Mycena sp. CBHHK59/15]